MGRASSAAEIVVPLLVVPSTSCICGSSAAQSFWDCHHPRSYGALAATVFCGKTIDAVSLTSALGSYAALVSVERQRSDVHADRGIARDDL